MKNRVADWQASGPMCPKHRQPAARRSFRICGLSIRGWRCPVKGCAFEVLHPKDVDDALAEKRDVRLAKALRDYTNKRVSTGRAAEIAGIPYGRMIDETLKHNIPLRFGPGSIAEAEREEKDLVARLKRLKSS